MRQKCEFNSARDVGKTLQGLAPDINAMIKTHTIPDSSGTEVYNQLAELSQIGVRINDDFDAIMISRGLKQLGERSIAPNGGTGSSQGVQPVAPAGATPVTE